MLCDILSYRRSIFNTQMNWFIRKEKTLIVLLASGFVGFLCETNDLSAAEVAVSHIEEALLPETAFSIPVMPEFPSPLIPSINEEKEIFFQAEQGVSLEGADFPPFPTGKEVSLQRLDERFTVGKRVFGQVYRPESTFSYHTGGGLRNYMGWDRSVFPLDPIYTGLSFTESTLESLHAFSVPVVGGLLQACLESGKEIAKIDRKFKSRYHLHFRFSGKALQAAYKDSF